MNCLRSISIALFLLSILLSAAVAATITAVDAKNHIGEQATVCGKVAGSKTASSSKGEPTFINLDAAYPNQIFTILVWGDDRKSVGELPQVGSRVCATGLIKNYRGVPEIVIQSSGAPPRACAPTTKLPLFLPAKLPKLRAFYVGANIRTKILYTLQADMGRTPPAKW